MPSRTPKAAGVTVKSSMRTLEILEYCDAVRRPVTISELVAKLDYPQSSTSALVQSMINHGYLVLGPDGRGITPSARVSALGRWIEPSVPRAEMKTLMERVGAETGQTVLLGIPSGLCVRYIDVVPGRHLMRLDIPIGSRLPLVQSGMGALLLSAMTDAEVAQVLERTRERVARLGARGVEASALADLWNADPVVPRLEDVMAEIAIVRACGFSLSLGRVTLGAGIVCVSLPTQKGEQPIGLGVGGLSTLIARDRRAILSSIVDHADRVGIPIRVDFAGADLDDAPGDLAETAAWRVA